MLEIFDKRSRMGNSEDVIFMAEINAGKGPEKDSAPDKKNRRPGLTGRFLSWLIKGAEEYRQKGCSV